VHHRGAWRVQRRVGDQIELPCALRRVDIQMGRNRDTGRPSALDEGGQKQLEANQLDWLVAEQMAVLPEIARAISDRAAVLDASAELRQGGQSGQGAQDSVVLIANAAAPAAVGQLVVGQPA